MRSLPLDCSGPRARFSRPLDLTSPFSDPFTKMSALMFEEAAVASLPEQVRAHVPTEAKKVSLLKGKLQEHIFQGTLNEIRPLLGKQTASSGTPAALISADKTRFALTRKSSMQDCGDKKVRLDSATTTLPEKNKATKVDRSSFCQSL